MSVPGWHGKGSGGSAASNPANSVASAAMLDAIAGTESGKAAYDAVLGNGRYGTPNKPISKMTVDEAYAFGRTVLARHGSSSALGRYQIVGKTMRAAQRALGISGSATFDPAMQDRMARWIARTQGLGAWEGLKHNPGAMARARQALANGGAKDVPGGGAMAGLGPTVPSLSGAFKSGADGLRIKSAEAMAGGRTDPAILAAAQMIQSGNVAGGLNRFTAFNDLYHKGTRSKHASGLAGDFTLNDPRQSRAAAEQVRQMFRSAGLADADFKVIDEYTNPSSRATGGHIHYQINSAQAALRYAQAVQARAVAATKSMKDVAEAGRKADAVEFKSSGWQPGWRKRRSGLGWHEVVGLAAGGGRKRQGPVGCAAEALDRRHDPQRADAAEAARRHGWGRGAGGNVHITQHIHGSGNTPEQVANLAQRKITEDWNHRSHDLEPELT